MPLPFLAGVRALDLSQYIPGPYAGLMLADLGADVVKVEPPGGDPARMLGPRDRDGVSPFWKLMNGGKTILTVDLKTDAGKAGLADLIARADVLIESYRPGVFDRLGFGRERLTALNLRLVHAALSGYGQTGPWRLRTGHDLNYMALAGGLVASGADGRPVMAAPPTADFASGLQTALAICGALVGRGRTGCGAYIDVSLTETVLAWQSHMLTAALRPGFGPAIAANLLNGGAACYRIYRAANGRFVTLAAIEEKFWQNFCAAVKCPGWVARQWEPMPQTVLIGELDALFAGRPVAEWEALLGPVDCCFGVVVAPAELPTHPQIAARGMVARHPGPDATVEALFPAHVDGHPPALRPSPIVATLDAVRARWTVGA
ncbi:MAG: CoA transferase [Rhodospirillales bacterium]|nr:CoA transferase [Rhodospirillales bacterium]